MASTPTGRLRLIKQATFDNPDAWGEEMNKGALDMTDEAFGVAAVTVNANVTLSAQNFLSDQARRLLLAFSGAGGFNVTVPAPDKPYIVMNGCAADVTIVPQGGAGAVVRAGTWAVFYSDGTNGHVLDQTLDRVKKAAAAVDLNSQKITHLANPIDDADAANKGYVDGKKLSGFRPADASVDFGGQKGVNVATPDADGDIANRKYVDDADVAMLAQVVVQVGIAAGHAEDAGNSAGAASGSAAAASGFADDASGFAGAAAGSAAAALSTYKEFDKRYLGAKSSAPTVDNEGNPLIVGALYFNSTVGSMFVYDGSNWIIIDAVTFANQAQAEAGTDNSTVMTPLRTVQSIDAHRKWTQIASFSPTSGSAVTFSSIPQGYGSLYISLDSVVLSGNGAMQVSVSADNTNFSTPQSVTATPSSHNGGIEIVGSDRDISMINSTLSATLGASPNMTSPGASAGQQAAARHTGGLKALRLSLSANTFTSGTITLFAR